MTLLSHFALLAAIACVAIALLAPAVPIRMPSKPASGGGKGSTRRPRRRAARRAPIALTAWLARARRALNARVEAQLEQRLSREGVRLSVPALAAGEADTVAATTDESVRAEDRSDVSEGREGGPLIPAATRNGIHIGWPTLMDESARDLSLERRVAIVRALDAIGAEWCVRVLRAAANEESNSEILDAIAKALADNPYAADADASPAATRERIGDDSARRQASA